QAGVKRPFRGQARAGAGTTKRFRDRGNDADFAAAITVAPAVGDFAGVVRRHLFERPAGIEALNNFVGRYDFVQAPAVGVADIHEFDETQDVTAIAEVFGHGLDAVIIGTALDDHIDL